MAEIWLQLRVAKQVTINGNTENKRPGDWVAIHNKQMARLWVANGEAVAIDPSLLANFDNAGLLIRHSASPGADPFILKMPQTPGDLPDLPYDVTIMVDKGLKLKSHLLPAAVGMLERWHVCVPLGSYRLLAQDIGSDEAKSRTKDMLHDLRVPYYNTKLVIIRRDDVTRNLVTAWNDEMETGDDERLCFLRALYRVKPYCWPLPVSWGE